MDGIADSYKWVGFGTYVHLLTVMIVNLSREGKTKAIRIGAQTSLQAETRLFDATHKAESTGALDLSGPLSFPPQSMTLYLIQE